MGCLNQAGLLGMESMVIGAIGLNERSFGSLRILEGFNADTDVWESFCPPLIAWLTWLAQASEKPTLGVWSSNLECESWGL